MKTQTHKSQKPTRQPRQIISGASRALTLLLTIAALVCEMFSASAEVTTYSWLRFDQPRNPTLDSSGLGHTFVGGFTGNGESPFGTLPIVDNICVGGPLGPNGVMSQYSLRSSAQMLGGGNQGTMFVEATTNGVLATGIATNGNAWGNFFQTNDNWVVESWVLPGKTHGNGFVGVVFATGVSRNGRTPLRQSGVMLETSGTPTSYPVIDPQNQDGHVFLRCHAVCPPGVTNGNGTMDFYIGPSVLIKTPTNAAWIHAAVVRDTASGTVAWYTNGVMVGSTAINNVYTTNWFSSPTLCGLQDSGWNAQTAANGFTGIGFNYGGAARYEGFIAETRYSHFNPGQFSVTNLLTRRVAPGSSTVWFGPVVVRDPQNTTVWAGGAAAFACVAATDTSVQYQWQRGAANIPNATNRLYVLENTSVGADNGAQFRCILTTPGNGLTATSAVATLTVQANAPGLVTGYSNAVMAEASLISYFPMDGSGSVVSNVKNPAFNGSFSNAPFALRDGSTNRVGGNQGLSFNIPNFEYTGGFELMTNRNGFVEIPGDNAAFDFATASSGNGTIEAVIYADPANANTLQTGGGAEKPCFFSSGSVYNAAAGNTSPAFDYYTIGIDPNGAIVYQNSYPTKLVWNVPGGVLGRRMHVALVFSELTNVTLYVDGVNLGTKIQNGFGNTPPSASQPLTIGKRGGANADSVGYWRDSWRGTVDEVALYSTALSAAKIQEHVYRLNYGGGNNPASIVSITPSKTLFTGFPLQNLKVVAAGNPPYSYQWRISSANIANATNDTYAATGLAAGVYSYDVVVQGAFGGAVTSAPVTLTVTAPSGYAAKVFASSGGGPKAFYPLNETSGTAVLDWAGTHDGVLSGSYALSTGSDGPTAGTGSLRMFGTNIVVNGFIQTYSKAEVPYYPELNPENNGNFTHEMWYKPENVTTRSSCLLSSQVTSSGSRAGLATFSSPNTAVAGIANFNLNRWQYSYGKYNNINQGAQNTSASIPVLDEWHHIVSVADGNSQTVQLYVNGIQEIVQNQSYSQHPGDGSTTGGVNQNYFAPLVLGNLSAGALGSFPMQGRLSQVAIYDYALSYQDVTNHTSQFWTNAVITSQPTATTTVAEASGQNPTTPQNVNITLTVGARGLPNDFEWYKISGGVTNPVTAYDNLDGTPHFPAIVPASGPTQGPLSKSLVINQPKTNDTGVYFLRINNPLNPGGFTNSALATVTVTPETAVPVAQSASARGVTVSGPVLDEAIGTAGNPTPAALNVVVVRYSERVDWATATNPANYVISGGVTVTNVVLPNSPADTKFGGDYRSVGLVTTGLTPGTSYTVTITNVYDQASFPNKMANTTLSFTAPALRANSAVWNYYYRLGVGTFASLAAQTNAAFPYVPQYTAALTNMSSDSVSFNQSLNNNPVFSGQADNYASTITAWVTPTNTGYYEFFINGDDQTRLYLNSAGADPAGAQWIGDSFSTSAQFNDIYAIPTHYLLTAGQPYFLQIVSLEGGGGDNSRAGWRYLGTVDQSYDGTGANGAWIVDATNLPPIQSTYLSSYAPGALSIAVQPSNITSAAGVTTNLSVVVSAGAGSYVTNYTWYESGSMSLQSVNGPGATSGAQGSSNPLNFAPLSWSNFATNWYVVVNDGSQFVTSSIVTVKPIAGVGITANPTNRAIALNALNNTLTFTATNSAGAMIYQWRKDGTNVLSALWNPGNGLGSPNGNSSTFAGNALTFNIMLPTMTGAFQVIATDPWYGLSATSTVANVTIATNQTINTAGVSGNNVNLNFSTENGPQYVLEWKGALTNGNWNTYRTVVGNGAITNISVAKTNTQSYFRLRMQ